nr:unnamed protein product [Digitaria exilis]
MDAAGYPHMQGSGSASASCRAADYSAAWDAAQQQKRQRCQDSSSSDQVGSSTENKSLEASGTELKFDYGKNQEEDYYFGDDDDDCYDDDNDGSDYEYDPADYNQLLADKFDHLDLPTGVEASVPWLQKVERDVPGKFKSMSEIEEEIAKKYNFFKQFDTVDDFSDHHYAKSSVGKARKEWAKRIQHEWSLLEKDLPAMIYVRVSENRMDLLRAVMIGPQGTPYHDGLFFFDAQFPASYPAGPPKSYGIFFVFLNSLFQHFEDLVAGHFRERGPAILAACKYYMEGHEVGCKVPAEDEEKKESQDGEGSSNSSVALTPQNKPKFRSNRSPSFKPNLEVLFEELLMEFNVKGSDTAKFRAQKLKNQQADA